MTITKSQKINLGIFVIFSVAVFVIAVIFFVGISLWDTKDPYTLRFSADNVSFSGLDIGSSVKYSGIQIGRVSAIEIDPSDVSVILVKLEINEGTPIAEDSVATLGSIGITGLKYIELSRGSPSARIRQPGEEIPSGPSFMDEITGKATVIATKTELLLNKLNLFMNDENQKKLWDTVSHIDELALASSSTINRTGPELDKISKNVADLVTELKTTATVFRQFVQDSSPQMKEMLAAVSTLAQNISVTRMKLDGLIDESKIVMSSLGDNLGEQGLNKTVTKFNAFIDQCSLMLKQSEEEISITLELLKETSENLDDFSILIKENPSLLLRSPELEERDVP